MGIFYFVKSVALIEDLPIDEEHTFASVEDFYAEADRGYTQVCQIWSCDCDVYYLYVLECIQLLDRCLFIRFDTSVLWSPILCQQ